MDFCKAVGSGGAAEMTLFRRLGRLILPPTFPTYAAGVAMELGGQQWWDLT